MANKLTGTDDTEITLTLRDLKDVVAEELERAAKIARATVKISDVDERDFFRTSPTEAEEREADAHTSGALMVADQLDATAAFFREVV